MNKTQVKPTDLEYFMVDTLTDLVQLVNLAASKEEDIDDVLNWAKETTESFVFGLQEVFDRDKCDDFCVEAGVEFDDQGIKIQKKETTNG